MATKEPIDMKSDDDGFEHLFNEEWSDDTMPNPSPFKLDDWELSRGEDISAENPFWAAEGFAASFRQYPELEQSCQSKRKEDFFRTLLESPDFQNLHRSTAANVMASDMSGAIIAKQIDAMMEQDAEREKKNKNDTQEEKEMGNEIGCIAAVSKAVQEATEEVEQLQAMCNAFGLNPGAGGETDIQAIKNQFMAVRGNADLRRIIELAGRYRFSAQSKQRNKTKHGYDDVVGVEIGGDIGRALPIELGKLGDDDLSDDVMRRLADNQLMMRQFRGVEPQAKGPVVVCIDESGSMSGERIAHAKAFALAMMWIAKKQKRGCLLVSFSTGPSCTYVNQDSKDLYTWLKHFYNGGTDLTVPCVVVPQFWLSFSDGIVGKTDMIIVTDAQLKVEDKMRDNFLKWKKENDVKVQTIVIGGSGESMKCISDQIHETNCISVDGLETQTAFSI